MQNGVQCYASKVYLMKWPVSIYFIKMSCQGKLLKILVYM